MVSKEVLTVKRYLFRTGLQQNWLVEELDKSGIKITKSYLSKILNEKISNSNTPIILNKSIALLADYCATYGEKYPI